MTTVNHRHLSEEITLLSCIALYYVLIHVRGEGLALPLWSSTSPAVTRFFLRIHPSDLGSGIHFVSTRLCCVVTGDCVALRVRTAARWTGLGSTKRWCQQMEATDPLFAQSFPRQTQMHQTGTPPGPSLCPVWPRSILGHPVMDHQYLPCCFQLSGLQNESFVISLTSTNWQIRVHVTHISNKLVCSGKRPFHTW